MAPLINRITTTLRNDNAESLEDLLPEISSSESPDYYIGNILIQVSTYGYVEGYKIIVGTVFKRPNRHYDNIERAVSHAIDGNHSWIANDLLDKTRLYLGGLEHDNVLHFSLRSAAWANNIAIAQKILKENLSTTSLDAPLSIACSRGHVEVVALMVNSLMKGDKETTAIPHPKVELGRVLEESLRVSIQKKFHRITAILLAPYLECVAYFNTPADVSRANEILEKVRDEDYATISRQTCFKPLSSKISEGARQGISRRLRLKEPKDLRLSAGGQTFLAHKDVLSYWSSYFASLSKNQFADSEHVHFGDDISAASVEAILDFAYCGTYNRHQQGITTEKRITELEDLLATTDYFGINCLEREVEEYLKLLGA